MRKLSQKTLTRLADRLLPDNWRSGQLPSSVLGGQQTPLATLEDKLRALIEIPTITGDFEMTNSALKLAADFLQQHGMHVNWHTYDGYECFAATTRPTKTPTVYLYAHMDVVPALPELFTLQKEDGKYIGRGVYDMKGTLAAYMQVVEDLGSKLAEYDFGIIVTSDEELGSKHKSTNDSCFNKLLEDGYLAKIYIMPDGARDWQLESSAKGFIHYALTASGKAAHGSRPWEGDNAIHRLMDALNEFRTHFKDHGPDTDTLNIGSITGGDAANQVPHTASAEIEMRPSTPGSHDRLVALVQKICNKHGIEYKVKTDLAMTFHDLTNPYLVSFASSIKKVVGVEPKGYRSLGGSDARFLTDYKLPAAVFYPFGGGHHSNKEWLVAGELEHMRDVYLDYLEREAHKS